MSHRDLNRVEKVFHAVLELAPDLREAYLIQECTGDEELYAEVSSLISAYDSNDGFIEEPALTLGLRVLSASSEQEMIGKTIGTYQVISRLGKGGMGEVYLAEDTKLGRKVALKFLSQEFVGDNWAKRQLVKEAQAVAMLDHPNICPVYGIEEIGEHMFIVMQYVQGETLAELIDKQQLSSDQIVPLARQIVGALAEAHAHGVIHRDIKPKNIMVTRASQIKVLDFGLAKSIRPKTDFETSDDSISHLSNSRLVPGTINYMSPEQLKGERLDYTSDIFSTGIVLYEMINGENPFARGSDAETIATILSEPLNIHWHPGQLDSLKDLTLTCLHKSKNKRYQSAVELLLAVEGAQVKKQPNVFSLRLSSIVIAALVVLMAVAFIVTYFHGPSSRTLAILPFSNRTGDKSVDFMSSGLSESLIDSLSFTSGLRVLKSTMVAGYKDRENDPDVVGRALNVDAVLVGQVNKEGDNIVLQTRLVRTSDGSELWRMKSVLQPSEMLNVQRSLTTKIDTSFNASSSNNRKSGTTDNPDAYRLYLLGRTAAERGSVDDAIVSFKQATDLDPAFALAWSGLADAYASKPTVAYGSIPTAEAMSKASAAARRALEAGDGLAEPHISMGIIKMRFEWQWREAEEQFKRAIEIDPYRASAHVSYASLLITTGRFAEAIDETKKAKDLDPYNPAAVMSLGKAYYRARDFDGAIAYLRQVISDNPANWNAEYVLGYAYLKKGMLSEAITLLEKVGTTKKWLAAAPLGYAYARNGDRSKAYDILNEMETQRNIPSQERAIIYIGLGDKDRAFEWLEKAYAERFPPIISLTTEPIFDDLRSDPRFGDLAKRINLTP
jgi:serine/threonine-protein kinase